MFVKIQYQCYNLDNGKPLTEKELSFFVDAKDEMFGEFMREKGYVLLAGSYDPAKGVRDLFYERVVSA